jgi:hypothetical protein
MKSVFAHLLAGSWLFVLTTAAASQTSNEQLIKRLEGAAPSDIVANATIVNVAADGKMSTVREGTNGWTCMDPDPGGSPMCGDAGGTDWIHAYMSKGAAPQKLGFIYMLKGDTGASNTDPYAMSQTSDNNWVVQGPHVMIVGAEAKPMMQAYPRDTKADPKKPYIMWPGSPYEHIMLPVE